MSMEIENLELTIEDVLLLHQGWITKLFVEDNKTEVEIVALLSECQFSVTPEQIRTCLREWSLLSSLSTLASPDPELEIHSDFTSVNNELRIDTHSISDGWEVIHSQARSHSHSHNRLSTSSNLPFQPDSPTYTPSPTTAEFGPDFADRYLDRPLPSIPTSSQHKRKSSISHDRPAKDKLKLTCHHGPESHEVEMTLGILGQGQSPIDTYVSDDQSHERIAVGLERKPVRNDATYRRIQFRKAGQWRGMGSRSRTERGKRARTRKNGRERESRRHVTKVPAVNSSSKGTSPASSDSSP